MRKAIIVCAAIALVTGVGTLFAWKIVSSRSGEDKTRPGNYTLAAVTDGTDFGTDATANTAEDQPAAVTTPPTDNQPVTVAEKPDDEDQPIAVAIKPVDDQPVAVTAPPESDQPAAVTTKPAVTEVEAVSVAVEEEPAAEVVEAPATQPVEAVEVVEVEAVAVAVEEPAAEVVETPATQPVEAVEVVEVEAVAVAVEEPAEEVVEAPTTQPVEDKTVVLEEIAEAVTDTTEAVESEQPTKPVEIAAPAEIETTEPAKTFQPVQAAITTPEKVEEPAETETVETAQAEGEMKLEPLEVDEVVEVAVAEPAEAEVVAEPVVVVETETQTIEPEVVEDNTADQAEPVSEEDIATPAIEPEQERIDTTKTIQVVSEKGWKKPIPITFSVDYTMATDYIFRGINFSEYRRSWGQAKNEGREKLNHQLSAGAELDMQKFGRVGYSVWFEWFAGQHYLTPEDGHKNLQEVDHTVYYGYNIEPLGLDIEAGFIWYMFPRVASGDGSSTQEIYLRQTFDDSVLWRALGFKNVKNPILNPYLFMAWDLDLARGGMYSEFGMSHDFELGELGMNNIPIAKDITITPTWSMGWDKNWLNKMSLDWMQSHPAGGLGNEGRGTASNSSHLDFMNWGLEMNFDLKSALKIPDKYCGEMYIKGFLNYSDAIAKKFLNDEFYGGMSVGFSW